VAGGVFRSEMSTILRLLIVVPIGFVFAVIARG